MGLAWAASCTLKGRGVSCVTPDDARCKRSPAPVCIVTTRLQRRVRAMRGLGVHAAATSSPEISKGRCRSCRSLRPRHAPGHHHRSPCSQGAEVPFGNATAQETRPPAARPPGPLRMTENVEDVVILHVNCSHHPLFSGCLSLAACELEAPSVWAGPGRSHSLPQPGCVGIFGH